VVLDKSDIALYVSVASAAFTGLSLIYTRILAKNDAARMRRKAPVFEARIPHPWRDGEDWLEWEITCRNLEPVSLLIKGARGRPRQSAILDRQEAYIERIGGFGDLVLIDGPLPQDRESSFRYLVGPVGTQRSESGYSPGDTVWLRLLTKGISAVSEIEFLWEWSDGKPD
jgi:hypothetical protein